MNRQQDLHLRAAQINSTTAKMCFNSFGFSVKVLIILLCLVEVQFSSSERTTPNPGCHDEAPIICKNIGSAEEHKNALASAFSGNHQIDLIFIICNTSDCKAAYDDVITFTVSLISLISTKYGSYIDADRVHVSMIAYDESSVRVTLNDTQRKIPTVGNCEFDKLLPNMVSKDITTSGDAVCKLPDSLREANTIFSRSTRPHAKKILWLLSNCRCCETVSKERSDVENAIGDIKRGHENIVVFTAGVSRCPKGYFSTLSQENMMKSIASSNSSHYACIESWFEFTTMEANSGPINESWSEVSEGVDIGDSCGDCAKATSSYRCACKIPAKKYFCHVFSLEFPVDGSKPSVLAIALGVGIGAGLFIIIVVIIIIVVVVRRSKRPSSPPPPLPRSRVKRPPAAAPPSPTPEAIYGNTDDEPIEYEIRELERGMSGWSAHLFALKQDNPLIQHLGIYSIDQDYFAQTPGFSLTQSEQMTLDKAMEKGNPGKNFRKKRDVTVGSNIYVIDRSARETLGARSRDNASSLRVVHRDGYIVVGIADARGGKDCHEVVSRILDTVTPSDN